ncbi:MAG: hypothetical protein ACPGVG_14850, partial [Mycobacterium sp.]
AAGIRACRLLGLLRRHELRRADRRTMLREFRLEPTSEPDEKPHSRGVTVTPARGALAIVRRRKDATTETSDSASAAQRSR